MIEKFTKTPFMVGPAPIRRTLPYLKAGQLVFKDRVRIVEVHYNMQWKSTFDKNRPRLGNVHEGLREFYFWHIPQIQFKNPNVQIVRFMEMTPLPFIRCWLDTGDDVLFDCDSKSKSQILQQLVKTLGKTKEQLDAEEHARQAQQTADNPGLFGFNRERFCMCEVPGQIPCPGVVPLPKKMQGKYKYYKQEELEEWENNPEKPDLTEDEKRKLHSWFPIRPNPIVPKIDYLDKMEIGKPDCKPIDSTVRDAVTKQAKKKT